MGINFPTTPADGSYFPVPAQFARSPYGTGPLYRYRSASNSWRKAAGTAQRSNKLVNGAMQISQERGDTALVCLTGFQYYAADQWRADFSMGASTQINCQRLAGVTPRGSKYRFRLNVVAAQASIAVSDYVIIRQFIEGNRISDLNWGTAQANWAVLRFGFRGPAGTYTAALRNGGAPTTRNLVLPFTITAADANWDQEYSFAIPPCYDAIWNLDNTVGVELLVAIAAGSNYYAPGTFSWQNTNFWSDGSITNNINTVGKDFHLFDVGLHADPLATGVAPEFQAPGLHADLQDCLRYWWPAKGLSGVVVGAATARVGATNPVMMRTTPVIALVGTVRVYDASVAPNVSAIAVANISAQAVQLNATASGMTVGRPAQLLVDASEAAYVAVSARF